MGESNGLDVAFPPPAYGYLPRKTGEGFRITSLYPNLYPKNQSRIAAFSSRG